MGIPTKDQIARWRKQSRAMRKAMRSYAEEDFDDGGLEKKHRELGLLVRKEQK